jgi:hypothetical protein
MALEYPNKKDYYAIVGLPFYLTILMPCSFIEWGFLCSRNKKKDPARESFYILVIIMLFER